MQYVVIQVSDYVLLDESIWIWICSSYKSSPSPVDHPSYSTLTPSAFVQSLNIFLLGSGGVFQPPVLAPSSFLSDYCLGITSWQFFTGYLFMPSTHSWYDQPTVLFHLSPALHLTYHYWLTWSFWTNCALFHDSRHERGVFPAVSSAPPLLTHLQVHTRAHCLFGKSTLSEVSGVFFLRSFLWLWITC